MANSTILDNSENTNNNKFTWMNFGKIIFLAHGYPTLSADLATILYVLIPGFLWKIKHFIPQGKYIINIFHEDTNEWKKKTYFVTSRNQRICRWFYKFSDIVLTRTKLLFILNMPSNFSLSGFHFLTPFLQKLVCILPARK